MCSARVCVQVQGTWSSHPTPPTPPTHEYKWCVRLGCVQVQGTWSSQCVQVQGTWSSHPTPPTPATHEYKGCVRLGCVQVQGTWSSPHPTHPSHPCIQGMCSAMVCASARYVIIPPHPTHPTHPWIQVMCSARVCASARYVIIPPHPTHPTHPWTQGMCSARVCASARYVIIPPPPHPPMNTSDVFGQGVCKCKVRDHPTPKVRDHEYKWCVRPGCVQVQGTWSSHTPPTPPTHEYKGCVPLGCVQVQGTWSSHPTPPTPTHPWIQVMCSARVCASARYVIIPPHPTHPTHPGQAIPIFGRKWPQIVVASDRMHFWVLLALSAKVTFCGRKWPHFVVTSDPNPVFLFMVASDRILWSQVTAMPSTSTSSTSSTSTSTSSTSTTITSMVSIIVIVMMQHLLSSWPLHGHQDTVPAMRRTCSPFFPLSSLPSPVLQVSCSKSGAIMWKNLAADLHASVLDMGLWCFMYVYASILMPKTNCCVLDAIGLTGWNHTSEERELELNSRFWPL